MSEALLKKRVVLFIVISAFFAGMSTHAQMRPGDVTVVVQAAAHFADRMVDFSQIGYRDIRQHRYRELHIALTPAWWTGERLAIELEFGFHYSHQEQLYDDRSYPVWDYAIAFIPHLMVALGSFDSTLIPYVRAGLGFSDNLTTPTLGSFGEDLRGDAGAFVASLGVGGMYYLASRVFLRGEVNYRVHKAESGSNTTRKVEWTAYNFYFGVGILW
jgi:hypothetical protein